MKWSSLKPFKKLVSSNGGSTAGRNNAGRITIWHRGGGAKRLQRKIDMKRNTSSMGIVERIEYDPNRSSRVALVRWVEGVKPQIQDKSDQGFAHIPKTIEPVTTTVAGQMPLASLAGHLVTGAPSMGNAGSKVGSVKDVFVSAFSKSKGGSLTHIPRIAVAGARPSVYVSKTGEAAEQGEKAYSLSDVKRWKKDSPLWDHRLKSKAAVNWVSFVHEDPVGLAVAVDDLKSVSKKSKKGAQEFDKVPMSYIIASNDMQPGQMVMNVGSKKPAQR